MSLKVVKFRVYPESVHGFYFDVEIYPTKGQMQKAARRSDAKRKDFGDCEAVCLGFGKGYITEDGRTVWRKILGKMVFHGGSIGMEVISHECTHAAFRWAEMKKFSPLDADGDRAEGKASDNEEKFCHALGTMAAQIGRECWKQNIYE